MHLKVTVSKVTNIIDSQMKQQQPQQSQTFCRHRFRKLFACDQSHDILCRIISTNQMLGPVTCHYLDQLTYQLLCLPTQVGWDIPAYIHVKVSVTKIFSSSLSLLEMPTLEGGQEVGSYYYENDLLPQTDTWHTLLFP